MSRYNEDYNKKILEKCHRTGQPYFVLCADDIFGSFLVKKWTELAEAAGVNTNKIEAAKQCSRAMKLWPTKKVPD